MKKKYLSLIAAAGCAFVAGAATSVVSESFEAGGAVTGLTSATWTGNGTMAAPVAPATLPTGDLPTDNGSNAKVLNVQGKVKCAVTTTAGRTMVDLMVQIAKPDEALAMPSDVTDAKFAVGVDQDGKLKAYCKAKGAAAAWVDLGITGTEGGWKRVTLIFDYAKKTCQVVVDGVPALTTSGYPTSDPEAAVASSVTTGSWYGLLDDTASKLESVEVIGSTAIDEMVVATGDDVEPRMPAPAGDAIPATWYIENGVSPSALTAPDGSGMTMAAKYQTGVSPISGEKFEIKSMAMSGAAGSVKVTLDVPAAKPAAGFKNVIVYGASPSAMTESKDIEAGKSSVDVNVTKGAGATKFYYQIKSVSTTK